MSGGKNEFIAGIYFSTGIESIVLKKLAACLKA